jgi:hypothetical protein
METRGWRQFGLVLERICPISGRFFEYLHQWWTMVVCRIRTWSTASRIRRGSVPARLAESSTTYWPGIASRWLTYVRRRHRELAVCTGSAMMQAYEQIAAELRARVVAAPELSVPDSCGASSPADRGQFGRMRRQHSYTKLRRNTKYVWNRRLHRRPTPAAPYPHRRAEDPGIPRLRLRRHRRPRDAVGGPREHHRRARRRSHPRSGGGAPQAARREGRNRAYALGDTRSGDDRPTRIRTRSADGRISVVHNGIIDNAATLRNRSSPRPRA